MELSISGSVSDTLAGRTVALGVTGSIAAVRVVDLVRDLIRRGADVHCVMSEAAQRILHPHALEYASNNPVITEITGRVEHVELCGVEGRADMLLIAPATANTIGKIACGIDDTPVTTFATTAIGSGKPVVVVPAMHEAMYRHPAVVENLKRLISMGVVCIDPRIEESKAKIAENARIVAEVERILGPGDLRSRRILVTSGATAESIDPIRIITNRASGRTGVEIAREAYRRGAEVTIVHRSRLGLPFKEIYVESAQDMLDAVMRELSTGYDALIGAAAVGDFTVDTEQRKIKSKDEVVLRLKPAPKILRSVRSMHPNLAIIGFKAETFVSDEDLIRSARESMEASCLNLVIANDVGAGGMGTDDNRVLIVREDGSHADVSGKKSLIARRVIDELVRILNDRDQGCGDARKLQH
ncbi:MAG: bifunctional phosphopantothenoylcysteine decarboxylase/phosphopantothenate--cysteine ligase CoaBC [Methanothrix sp.]|uniref:bifunctional phosphopantothenoylcysteine decarboxylase/phosphopantothenate--cysteine ligase CoaBC n=1 Tax=Methanothrix sp. TaxID=90426 RepID=UPI0025D7872A|nr:bifunctional phosphopantothenoylcysteine decarboxylase/phosphopantothenate--cysteine ligase CoaBC [Methanothrix sp.]MCQ8902651.1 bifunctional phosphopantothenoylcysteine decarboxylase/phosphopantothenate--cysteine ligase CoaBC [Methanothrix sp.]